MLLQRLQLTNIRSYKEAIITFPKGSILLSGDVGSGKTTILLAIEFALFGIFRGELSASSLLRHGEKEGVVRLTFTIDNNEYCITRTLRRDHKGINQGPGKLKINHEEESLTPVELKARILSILGYSHDLLTKAKSLVFRYTVYTPQEEMKRILFESTDTRLETLRKVFGIDQYKIIKENTTTMLKELRAEEKALQLRLEELPHQEKELKQLQTQKEAITNELISLEEKEQQQKQLVKKQLEELNKLKEEQEEYTKQKNELAILQTKKEQTKTHINTTKQQQEQLTKKLRQLQQPIKQEYQLEELQALVTKKEQAQNILQERIQKTTTKKAEHKTLQTQTEQNKQKLTSIGSTCPLCEQEVPHEHINKLVQSQEKTIAEHEQQVQKIRIFEKEAQTKLKQVQETLQQLRQQQLKATQQAQQEKNRQQQLQQVQEQITQQQKQEATLQEQQKQLQQNSIIKQEIVQKKQAIITKYQEQEQQYETQRQQLQTITITKTKKEAELHYNNEQTKKLQRTIQQLQQLRQTQHKTKKTMHWLKEIFTPLTTQIEQAVFASLHQEFNTLFSNWFNHILEDEALQVRLDQEFTPIIELNGYETETQALSGGEKTALALAYRLSLNQVINEFIGTINTKNLLILDEPTDGFSTHQLDNMREVLQELHLEQLILVSHETTIEGFVEHIIRITKQEQTSTITQ